MTRTLTKAVSKAAHEAKLWAYAAWTLPFAALAAIVFEYFIGWDSLVNKTIILIAVGFFSISVFWWWWALSKIVVILNAMNNNEHRFDEIREELRETRIIIRETAKKENVGHR